MIAAYMALEPENVPTKGGKHARERITAPRAHSDTTLDWYFSVRRLSCSGGIKRLQIKKDWFDKLFATLLRTAWAAAFQHSQKLKEFGSWPRV
jgi:hypothetical protein